MIRDLVPRADEYSSISAADIVRHRGYCFVVGEVTTRVAVDCSPLYPPAQDMFTVYERFHGTGDQIRTELVLFNTRSVIGISCLFWVLACFEWITVDSFPI